MQNENIRQSTLFETDGKSHLKRTILEEEMENKMSGECWLSDAMERKNMQFCQNSGADDISIRTDSRLENEDDVKNEEEEKESDEDESIFLDCESVTERLVTVIDREEISTGKVSEMSRAGNDQVSQFEEEGQGGRLKQNNIIKRKKSWKRKKCLSLDNRRWDNAKDTISKGRKVFRMFQIKSVTELC